MLEIMDSFELQKNTNCDGGLSEGAAGAKLVEFRDSAELDKYIRDQVADRTRFTKASDSPITAEFLEAQLPSTKPLFEVGGGGLRISGGATKDFTFAVNPLSLGQHIEVAPVVPLSESWEGIVWKTWVSALNEITIRLANVTNHSIKPALQGFFTVAGTSLGTKALKLSIDGQDLRKTYWEFDLSPVVAGPLHQSRIFKSRTTISVEPDVKPLHNAELEKLRLEMAAQEGPPTKDQIEKHIRLKYGPDNKFPNSYATNADNSAIIAASTLGGLAKGANFSSDAGPLTSDSVGF